MLLYALGGLAVLVLVVLGGLFVQPGQFAAPEQASADRDVERIPVPEDLPAPVERWLLTDYPDGLPVAESIVMRGTGVMRIGPLAVPMRHTVEIRPGEGFFRRMDLTWYGIAFAHGKDTFVSGHGRMETPVGAFEGAKIDQGANIVNWLEVLSAPGVLAKRDDVRWEPVDDRSARLVFPFGDGEDSVTVTFDPVTGKPVKAFAMRFKDADASAKKLGWTAGMSERGVLGGIPVSIEVDATWEGYAKPWATFEYSDAWVNVPVPSLEAAELAMAEKE